MKTFQYEIKSYKTAGQETFEALNLMGKAGWELVTATFGGVYTVCYFKREIPRDIGNPGPG